MDDHKFIIDFHCHSIRDSSDNCIEIVSCDPLINTADGIHTVGFHPWWHMDHLQGDEMKVIENDFLTNKYCVGIGECGLDKAKGASEEIQMDNFLTHIEIANRLKAPVIVHCVKKYNVLTALFKRHAQTPWTTHGFSRNKTLAKSLIDQGIRLSVAPHQRMNASMSEMLKYLPMDMFFLETDSDRRTPINERYALMAQLKSCKLPELKATVIENVYTFFGPKFSHLINQHNF